MIILEIEILKMGNISLHGRPAEERTGAQKEKLSLNIFI